MLASPLVRSTIPIFPNSFHLIALPPCATKPNPIIAPTTLCVEDTGTFMAVAIISHTAPPDKALNEPKSTSLSVPLPKLSASTIFPRIVSERILQLLY